MNEPAFWQVLVARVCVTLERGGIGGIWCDQFVPESFTEDEIQGHAWIGVGPREHEKWQFVFVLKEPASSRESIVWSSLLPPAGDDSTWITVDRAVKKLRFEPGLHQSM